MSKLITDTIRHTGGSADNITLDGSQNVTCEANLQVDGNVTVTGTLPAAQLTGTVADARISTLTASKLTGALPAISGASLTGITDTLSFRNLIINGAMVVAQRGTSFTVSDAYTLDRYKFKINGGGATTITQSSTTPDDFSYSYKVDVTTADTSVSGTDHGIIMHMVEGYDFAQANFGSSAAKACKLSFYVRSNKTGTYGVAFQNSAQNRSCIQEYTINSADTWERKTITIPADTGGSWLTTSSPGLRITWGLMGGSTYATSSLGTYNSSNVFLTSNQVNLFDNTSNEWYMTGVQLEVGSTATDFEHRSYADELARCHRYYRLQSKSRASGKLGGSQNYVSMVSFPLSPQMRNTPTVSMYGSASYNGNVSTIDTVNVTLDHIGIMANISDGNYYYYNNGWTADAEL